MPELLSAQWPALNNPGRVKPGQFKQGDHARIFFARSFMQNHNLA
jgi:hypothetical protein